MVLVLAFSVQGIADALTFGTTRTNDLKTIFVGDTIDITFSVTLDGKVRKPVYQNYTMVPNASLLATELDRPYYYDNSEGTGYTGQSKTSDSDAHYNNDQSITIASTSDLTFNTISGQDVSGDVYRVEGRRKMGE